MKRWTQRYLIGIAVALVFHGCSIERLLEFKCEECFIEKPLYSIIEANFTINNENQEIPLTIYLGSPDNNIVVLTDTITTKTLQIDVENEVEYTFVAHYTRNGRTHYVINTLKTKVYYDTESCSDPCYYATNKKINLEIKY
ncbi:MAG TPA: hypothetical protein VFC87_03375 [Perlabentimonas sp.]|nr:hypothetical protein [Perlabentimonas sp.]